MRRSRGTILNVEADDEAGLMQSSPGELGRTTGKHRDAYMTTAQMGTGTHKGAQGNEPHRHVELEHALVHLVGVRAACGADDDDAVPSHRLHAQRPAYRGVPCPLAALERITDQENVCCGIAVQLCRSA